MSKLLFLLLLPVLASAKEIALTFDDAPVESSKHFTSINRTKTLIRKLKALKIPPVMIFALPHNPWNHDDPGEAISHLKLYRDAGHLIENHTSHHLDFDSVGYKEFSADALECDQLLQPLFSGQKFFRFPYLHENFETKPRNAMRKWLKDHNYRNGSVSIDNQDYAFSFKINEARDLGLKVDYEKVKKLFLRDVMANVDHYDKLAVDVLGRSPKHVLLLHEMDATVMFFEDLVRALRSDGWTIISAADAYTDPIYFEEPRNTHAGNGLIAQLSKEKTGQSRDFSLWPDIEEDLDKLLGLPGK